MAGDAALQPVRINTQPGSEYGSGTRQFQGIPGIERAPNGRLWATWYAGGADEGGENYVVLVTSEDDGASWSEPVLVIDPPGEVRAFDPCLWHDPQGRLWLFWAQSEGLWDGRVGVWAMHCPDAQSATLAFCEQRRIGDGIMMNKPLVLSTGAWLLPTAIWSFREPVIAEMLPQRYSNVVASYDQGETFEMIGHADVPDRLIDEHMLVERGDGSVWMLVRCKKGVGQSVSQDGGHTWSPGKPTELEGPCSRFFVRRLRSGRLLLVNHSRSDQRSHLTAWVSEDDGTHWLGGLLLDERKDVSYPDGVESEDGVIYVIYDRERRGDKEILMAVFREEDVLAGAFESDVARARVVVNRGG